MEIKTDMQVVVLDAFGEGKEGLGKVQFKCRDRAFPDMWWVDLGDATIPVHPERMREPLAYFKEQRERRR